MGQNIASVSRKRNHTIEAAIDPYIKTVAVSEDGNEASINKARSLKGAELQKEDIDVIIDFSTAGAVKQNIDTYCALGIPVVIGTTGLGGKYQIIQKRLAAEGVASVYGSNFSVGVYLFSELAAFAAEKLNVLLEYDIALCEHHHRHKTDSPSGTARSIAEKIIAKNRRKTEIVTNLPERSLELKELSVSSVRAGEIPGTHQVIIDSDVDSIELIHRARSRGGFALGAVVAAEWITEEGRDVRAYTEKDVFNDILGEQS